MWAVAAAAVAAALVARDHHRSLAEPLAIDEAPMPLVVEPGTTLRELVTTLAERGVIEHPLYFVLYARWRGDAQRIKAGEYAIEAGTTPLALLEQLVAGRVVQHSLTLLEGWTFAEIRAAVAAHEALETTLEGTADPIIMARLGMPGMSPEGWFFPDTYHFPRGTTDFEFLARAHRTMRERLEREWAERAPDLPFDDPYEALILASIVEKETGHPEERARIAGVFVRRLGKGMRLEADPTVIYGLGERFDGNLSRVHLRTDSPYNTYTRHGLPPTPIGAPGAASIHAALNPAPGEALYFVAKGDGSHQFSRTYDEHLEAVRRYQLSQRRTAGQESP